MIAFMLAGVLVASQSTDTISASIDVPEVIIPAVEPYIDCLSQTQLTLSQQAGPVHWQKMQEIVEWTRERCASVRALARKKALRSIKRDKSVAVDQRAARVDEALANIDRSDDKFVAQVRRIDENQQAQNPK
jgi:hypothetical protein